MMIRADFYRDGERLCLTIKGHAEYGGEGNDIVCAAVSGIFYALTGYLTNMHREGVEIRAIGSGLADISCDGGGEEAMKLACIGLIQIEMSYPDCVLVNNRVWKWKCGSLRDIARCDA